MKILILALSGIGDALMFTPALSLLKDKLPDSQIDALVMYKGVKDIYIRNRNLNSIFYFDFLNKGVLDSFKYILKLRKKYDISINVYPSNRKEYSLMNFIIGAEKRAGVKYLKKGTANLDFLNNVTVSEKFNLHNVEENVKLIEKLTDKSFKEIPGLEFTLSEEDIEYANSFLHKHNIPESELIIGFHPGCATLKNHARRRWEPEKFSELANKLINNYQAKIMIFGGPEEKDLKGKVASGIYSDRKLIIDTDNLAQSAAIMKRCNLFITNDSSLMHIASALKLDVVAIIGPTNPNFIHPWQTNHKIVTLNLECAPCFFYSPKSLICYRNDILFKCIKHLNVDMVYNAAEQFLIKSRVN